MNYILASGSPRRQELLSLVVPEFDIVVADIEEICPCEIKPLDKPEYLALKKAKHIAKDNLNSVVIGADTAVFLGDKMLGKPKSETDAFDMLKSLSGKNHKVVTGCALILGDREITFSVVTEVEFFKLSDKEIREYISTKEPMDKAGAYGIQGFGALLVKGIKGDYFNVVGLPVSALKRELKKIVNNA